jgi:hypothetical protein
LYRRPTDNERILGGRVNGGCVMQNSQSYRENAAMCLLAAQEASDLNSRRLHLSMALSWLSLAREDQAVGDLIESWDAAKREA